MWHIQTKTTYAFKQIKIKTKRGVSISFPQERHTHTPYRHRRAQELGRSSSQTSRWQQAVSSPRLWAVSRSAGPGERREPGHLPGRSPGRKRGPRPPPGEEEAAPHRRPHGPRTRPSAPTRLRQRSCPRCPPTAPAAAPREETPGAHAASSGRRPPSSPGPRARIPGARTPSR